MIVIRSAEEIGSIRQAGRILAEALEKVREAVRPGVTTAELDAIARSEILKGKGYPAFKGYKGFPANICTSVNECVVHGIPSSRKLRRGDIVSIDVGVRYRDYYADAAETIPVGDVSEEAARLIDFAKRSLDAGIAAAVAGNRLFDISATIQGCAESGGFSVVRSFVGHGIGAKIHEEPEIPNFGKAGTGPRLDSGMVLAIEPMINAGSYEVEMLEDGWTAVTADRRLSAHFEHTIAITDAAAEILTRKGNG
jgi:methionyl aminopeptidase